MEHHHHQQRLNPYQYPMNPPRQPQGGGGGGGGGDGGERLPQWSHEETREFLAIRAQLDKSFSETKRNKPLWEATSAMLRQKGFLRTPDQCKSKWKNLVTRFKGSESEVGRQFPFHEEMRRIFSGRMERLLASEAASGAKGKGAVQVQAKESDEVEDDEEDEELAAAADKRAKRNKKKKSRVEEEVEAALREFMRRQLEMEARWLEAAAAREAERRAKEEEWRRMMEGLREERIEMVRRWRVREEDWRARSEARAERRHNLVVALLDKLTQKDP